MFTHKIWNFEKLKLFDLLKPFLLIIWSLLIRKRSFEVFSHSEVGLAVNWVSVNKLGWVWVNLCECEWLRVNWLHTSCFEMTKEESRHYFITLWASCVLHELSHVIYVSCVSWLSWLCCGKFEKSEDMSENLLYLREYVFRHVIALRCL